MKRIFISLALTVSVSAGLVAPAKADPLGKAVETPGRKSPTPPTTTVPPRTKKKVVTAEVRQKFLGDVRKEIVRYNRRGRLIKHASNIAAIRTKWSSHGIDLGASFVAAKEYVEELAGGARSPIFAGEWRMFIWVSFPKMAKCFWYSERLEGTDTYEEFIPFACPPKVRKQLGK